MKISQKKIGALVGLDKSINYYKKAIIITVAEKIYLTMYKYI